MKIEVKFVSLADKEESVFFLVPTLFISKDRSSLVVCISFICWGAGIVFSKECENESE